MDHKDFKQSFLDNYVFVKIDVMESGDKKSLENPHGMDVMKALKGETSGLPFFAILNPAGKILIDSKMPVEGKEPQNIGCPVKPDEVAHFMHMLDKTAPRMSKAQKAKLADYLRKQDGG
ncbi:MAG TPA: hypothetical protein VFG65_03310 [Fimbriimonadales bacterium]|nr:hypothetical protein [Fimbriimonadales bacterium]